MAFAMAAAAYAGPTFPPLTGRVVDEAGLLTPEDRAALTGELAALEETSTDQLAVVTLKSLQGYPIEDYGYQLGRAWGIGQKGKDNGVLLIVVPSEHKVRIEVGRGLEPILTDALSSIIINHAIVPEFRKGDFAAGIKAGVRDIKDVLLGDAEAVKERAQGARRGDSPDTMQVILLIFWICVVLYILYAVVSLRAGRATSRRCRGPKGRPHRHHPRQLRRLGRRLVERRRWRRRRLVGRRRRFRRRRLVGKLVRIGAGEVEMSLFSGDGGAARLRRDHAGRAQDLGRDRRRRRRAQRHLPLRSPADRSARRACSCPGR